MKSKASYLFAAGIAVFAFAATSAQAAVSFNLSYAVGGFSGLTIGTSRAILVVDTGSDGFSGISDPNTDNASRSDLANFSFTAGSMLGDDLVLAAFTAADVGGGEIGFQTALQAFQTFTTDPSYAGRQMALYYFPSGSNAAGQTFGYYRSSTVDPDSSTAYTVPSDGGSSSLYSLTPAAGGSGTTFNGSPSASGTIGAVPEPTRFMLGMLGFGALVLRRRRAV